MNGDEKEEVENETHIIYIHNECNSICTTHTLHIPATIIILLNLCYMLNQQVQLTF